MREMGYAVEKLAFYEISTNKMINVELPGEIDKQELLTLIQPQTILREGFYPYQTRVSSQI